MNNNTYDVIIVGGGVLEIDFEDIQKKIQDIASAYVNESDDCGDNVTISDVSLSNDGSNAKLVARAQYARWLCTCR